MAEAIPALEEFPAAQAFTAVITSAPDDGALKMVYADWLDEHREPDLAYTYRWMGKNGLHPHFREKYPVPRHVAGYRFLSEKEILAMGFGRKVPAAYSWAWYNADIVRRNAYQYPGVPAHACLPRMAAQAVVGYERRFYPSYAAAVQGLCKGLTELRKMLEV